MDVFFNCPLTNEDLLSVLRTIILFLESLKLKKTCEVLRNECLNLGFDVPLIEANTQTSSNEKAVDCPVFETSEEQTNSLNVYYCQNSPEKTLTAQQKPSKSAETVENNYNKSQEEYYNPNGLYNISPQQNGSGEKETLLDCNNKVLSFDEMFKKFKTLQVEHIKLMGITTELVKALQMGISGQSETFYQLREKWKEVYPDLFVLMKNQELNMDIGNKNEAGDAAEVLCLTETTQTRLELKRSLSDTCLKQKQNKLWQRESSKSLDNLVFEDTPETRKQSCEKKSKKQNDIFDIDYGRLKNDLINADDTKKMLILQALRWRVTKQSTHIRETVMASYIKHDLLCLQAPFREKLIFLESLYCPKNPGKFNHVQESIARLVNTFASLSAGRDYLCQYDSLLTQLLLPLILDKHHSTTKLGRITKDMVLATLQKLSLRFHARQKMIALGTTEFLINFLNEHHSNVSVYCLEYSTALLMNLCLHKEGRSKCTTKSRDVMRLIKNLLNSKYSENIMPYVTGTMYSLLGNRKINTEAKLMDLANILRYHIKHSSHTDNKKQLEYILKIHLEGSSIKHPDPKMEGDELDLLEPELEEDDPVQGNICGEEILIEYKLLDGNIDENNLCEDLFQNVIPATLRPRSVMSTRTENSEQEQLKGPHPSKCNMQEESLQQAADPLELPASPAESFSEVTKQFYHRPSKKKGIFDKRKLKFSQNPYQARLGFIGKSEVVTSGGNNEENNASVLCNCAYRTYECDHQNSNKYTCCCYKAMKAFIENTNTKARSDNCCQTSPKTTKCETLNKHDVKRVDASNLGNMKSEVETEGSCNKACLLEEGQNCCKCYNVIFQSRPRISRTPPAPP